MKDNKIIIIAVILAVLFIAYGWYYQKNNSSPSASISQTDQNKDFQPGITVGNESATVSIEEYTNFLCPACAGFAQETLPAVIENYVKTGKAKMVFYVFPPLELGQAALCAQEQGLFLEYHDYLFSHQGELTKADDLKTMAEKVGLAKEAFSECFDSKKHERTTMAWYQQGIEKGVTATPTFYINGEKLEGAFPFEKFEEIIGPKLNQQ